nr:hypothetical protein [Pantoea agglomerans]
MILKINYCFLGEQCQLCPASAFEWLTGGTLPVPAEGHKNRQAAARLNLPTFIGTLCKRAAVDSGINRIAAVFGIAWIKGFRAFLIFSFALRVMRFIPINTLRASIATGKHRNGQ